MGRLEDALERLADQDRHLDPVRVTDRLERRLRGGDLPVVVPDGAAEPPRAGRAAPWWRRGPLIALAGGVAAVAAVAVPLLLVGRGEPGGPATTAAPVSTTMPPTTVATTTLPPATTSTAPPVTSTAPPTTAATTTTTESTATLPVGPFPPVEVTLVFDIDGSSDVAYGTFSAAGPAVDAGVICRAGTSYERNFEASGSQERWTTVCTCGDGSGRFSLDVATVGEWEGGVGGSTWLFSGTWTLDEGSDAYAAMTGQGTTEGRCPGPDFDCTATYTGTVWRDG